MPFGRRSKLLLIIPSNGTALSLQILLVLHRAEGLFSRFHLKNRRIMIPSCRLIPEVFFYMLILSMESKLRTSIRKLGPNVGFAVLCTDLISHCSYGSLHLSGVHRLWPDSRRSHGRPVLKAVNKVVKMDWRVAGADLFLPA